VRLVLVRHGESIGNFENRLQGHTDYALTELGRRQAELTAARLASMGTSAVYTSPLMRASETARTIAEKLSVEHIVLAGVSEYQFGELAGSTYAEVRRHFEAQGTTAAQPQERTYPGEEGRENFFRRVTEALWRIIDDHDGETVAVVSHGGPIALFCQAVLGLPYRRPMPFAISNCSLTVIDAAAETPASTRPLNLLHLNDTCHLR
jgi:broad specificity phosphatase PhoE